MSLSTKRKTDIIAGLTLAEAQGKVRSWQTYSPGDHRGARWLVGTNIGTYRFTTREVEVFLVGIELGRPKR